MTGWLWDWARGMFPGLVVKVVGGVTVFLSGHWLWQRYEARRKVREEARKREGKIDAAVASVGRMEQAVLVLANRERIAHNLLRRLAFAAMQEPVDGNAIREVLTEMHDLREGSYKARYYRAARKASLPATKGPVDLQNVLDEIEEESKQSLEGDTQ